MSSQTYEPQPQSPAPAAINPANSPSMQDENDVRPPAPQPHPRSAAVRSPAKQQSTPNRSLHSDGLRSIKKNQLKSWIKMFSGKFQCQFCGQIPDGDVRFCIQRELPAESDDAASEAAALQLITTASLMCRPCSEANAERSRLSFSAPSFLDHATRELRSFISLIEHLKEDDALSSSSEDEKIGRGFVGRKNTNPESQRNNTSFEPRLTMSPTNEKTIDEKIRKITVFLGEEESSRSAIITEHAKGFLELQKKYSNETKYIRNKRKGTSRAFKVEADDNYEKANYMEAIALYDKAIALSNDSTTRPSVLYGNRSAAYFMAMRYDDCIADCMRVVAQDPSNIKMFSRAIKAAIMMGNLEKALDIHNKIPSSMSNESMQNERTKILSSIDELREAKKKDGTPEGNRLWELLTTKFGDTVVFRQKLAESIIKSGKRIEEAIEVLNVFSPTARSASVAYQLSSYYYQSGFENFERARETIRPHISDSQCAKLFKLISDVDEAKQTGNNLFSHRQFAASVEHYTRAIELDLTNARILRILYCNRAAAYKELQRLQEGVDDCTKAIDLDPAFSKAYARRARCLLLMKELDAAVRDFRKASELERNDQDLRRELANAEDALAKEIEKEKDFYYVLGVNRHSTDAEIKAQYRKLSLRWHPDKSMGNGEFERQVAERKFKAIAEAYATLSNVDKKREYDAKMDRERYRNSLRSDTNRYRTSTNAKYSGFTNNREFGGNSYW